MISNELTTPFAAKVLSNKQKNKATKGQRVLVVKFWTGQFGECVIAKVPNKDKVQFLSLKNLERIGDATAEEVAEQQAERKAWSDKFNAPVFVGTVPDWSSDKSVGFDWRIESNQSSSLAHSKRVRLFFPLSQWDAVKGTVPQWLWNKKVEQINEDYNSGLGSGFRYQLTEHWPRKKVAA
jgi:hypothetical protein